MNTNTEFYDKAAADYDAFYSKVDGVETVRQWLLVLPRYLSSEGHRKLLDIGCGPGFHLQAWRRADFEVAGLDSSSSMLRIAAARAPGVPLYCANILEADSLRPLHSSFDLCISHLNFINLFSSIEMPMVFKSVRQLLQRSGVWATDFLDSDTAATEFVETVSCGGRQITRSCTVRESRIDVNWTTDSGSIVEQFWLHSLESVVAAASAFGLRMEDRLFWQPNNSERPWCSPSKSNHCLLVFRKQ